ncbi:MAG: hypothetical protein M3O91_00005, partial [Chloroflexota bacterium]|nr:hypothetical protein [Chloroflexota bacterium]
IVATLLAQMGNALTAGACAAWAHGRAAEIAGGARVRGVTLGDVEIALGRVWSEEVAPAEPPALWELPSAGEH